MAIFYAMIYAHAKVMRIYINILIYKFLIIALMVEMGIFTALTLFIKPLH